MAAPRTHIDSTEEQRWFVEPDQLFGRKSYEKANKKERKKTLADTYIIMQLNYIEV